MADFSSESLDLQKKVKEEELLDTLRQELLNWNR